MYNGLRNRTETELAAAGSLPSRRGALLQLIFSMAKRRVPVGSGVGAGGTAVGSWDGRFRQGQIAALCLGFNRRMKSAVFGVRSCTENWEMLIKPGFVIPAKAGIQYFQQTGHRLSPV